MRQRSSGEVCLLHLPSSPVWFDSAVAPTGQFANFTTKSDVFSLGMILHFMCFGNLPYAGADLMNEENENLDSLRDEILAYQGLDERTRLRSDLPERLYQSLKTLISPDPSIRPSAEEILLGLGVGIGEEPPLVSIPSPLVPLSYSQNLSQRRGSTSSQKKPVVLDDQTTLGFRRISPVADTPPSSTPVGSPSTINLYDYDTFKQPPKPRFPLRSPTKRTSKLSAGPVFPPGETAVSEDPVRDSSIILRPRMDPITTVRALPEVLTWKRRVVLCAMRPEWGIAGKMLVFLVKAVSLTRPCSPAAPNPWVYYPLLTLAALDFAGLVSVLPPVLVGCGLTGGGRAWMATLVLGFVHVAVLVLVYQVGGMCLF